MLSRSISTFAAIGALLALFWTVFSIMGLHVFGGLALEQPWPNCDNLINCAILNFHVSGVERPMGERRQAGGR